MNYDYDVIVVGAGPSGSTTAIYAAKHNLKVLLIDKAIFPRDKICGDAIPGDCFPILEELNLVDELTQTPHGEGKMSFHFQSESLKFPFAQQLSTGQNIVCRRYIFDHILFKKAQTFVDTQEGFKLENLLMENNQVYGIEGICREGKYRKYNAKVIVGADGCRSFVAKQIGINQKNNDYEAVATRTYYSNLPVDRTKLEFHYLSDCIPGYFWIFPVDKDLFNVGVILFSDKEKKSSQAVDKSLKTSPFLEEKFAEATIVNRMKGWCLPIGSKQRIVHGNGFILVGDAAGLIDPMLGHGIDSAMISGKIAGYCLGKVCSAHDYSESTLKIYTDNLWETFGKIYQHRNTFRQKWFTSDQYRDNFLKMWGSSSR